MAADAPPPVHAPLGPVAGAVPGGGGVVALELRRAVGAGANEPDGPRLRRRGARRPVPRAVRLATETVRSQRSRGPLGAGRGRRARGDFPQVRVDLRLR